MPRYSLPCLATTWLPNVDVASHVYIRCCVYAAVCATTTMMMMIVLLYFFSRFHSALPLSLTLPSECASEVCILIQFFLIFVLLNKCAQVFVFSCVRVCVCVGVCMPLDWHTKQSMCVRYTEYRFFSSTFCVHASDVHIYIYRIFVYAMGDRLTQTWTHTHSLRCIHNDTVRLRAHIVTL